jgi:hypothetical protein
VAALLYKLMSLQRVFSRKSLPTTAVTQEWFFSTVCFAMPFQIVLAVKRQRAHVTRKWPVW